MKKKRSRSAVISNSRWTAYATAGAATALAGAGTAEAAIHHVDVNQSFSAPPGGSGSAVYGVYSLGPGAQFTVLHFLHTTAVNGHADFAINAGGSAAFVGYTTSAFGSGYVSKLAFGDVINAHANFVTQGSYLDYLAAHANRGQFTAPGIGFAGIRFNTGAGMQYGWVRFNMNGGPGNSFTLVDYAWGDVGDTITAGQVPEPGCLGLLALGGVGLMAWRKRRGAKAA